jgi:hypothetical protein
MICPNCKGSIDCPHCSAPGVARRTPQLLDVTRVAVELVIYALVIVTESCFLCVWALVVWGVAATLQLIEPNLPDWAPKMFRYVEIGFSLYILSQLFIRRVGVFENAIRSLRRLKRAWTSNKRAML